MNPAKTIKKTVVVIGGGHAGISLLRRLSPLLNPENHDVLLINPRPFAIWLPAMIRIVTGYHEDLEGRAFLPYTHIFSPGKGTFLEGEVSAIRKGAHGHGGFVVLKNGEEEKFDALVLATGSVWEGSFSFADERVELEKQIHENRRALAEAKSVILVGGGPIAIEYAGEIKEAYPDTDITIVHAASKLLNKTYPNKFREMVEGDLRARGVNLLLGDLVESIGGRTAICRSGKELSADLIIPCHGSRPNTRLLQSLDPSALTSTGHVRVTPHLQLPDHPEIFAIGDIIDYAEQKQAGKVHEHASVVANNVLSFLEEREKEAWKEYKGSYEILVLTNGKSGGASYFGLLGGLSFGRWITTTLLRKSRNLLIPFARKLVGLPN